MYAAVTGSAIVLVGPVILSAVRHHKGITRFDVFGYCRTEIGAHTELSSLSQKEGRRGSGPR